MASINQQIKAIEQGCNKNYCYGKCGDKSAKTGSSPDKKVLCRDCRLKLETLFSLKKMINEEIDKFPTDKYFKEESINDMIELTINDLKLNIIGETE